MEVVVEQLDLGSINPLVEKSGPEKTVEWAAAEFGADLVMSSSFGADSTVLLHMAGRILPRIKVIFVDTGYLFPETFAFMEKLRQKLDLNIWSYRTQHDPFEYLKRSGEDDSTFRKDITACCAANKNEPFERALKELKPKAWLRGIRRTQADTRKQIDIVEWSMRYDCYAISPLANWSGKEIHAYLQKHDLPRHPLYDKGYLSIGCNPLTCTRSVLAGEDPRSGRWSGQGKVECGINLVDSLDSAKL